MVANKEGSCKTLHVGNYAHKILQKKWSSRGCMAFEIVTVLYLQRCKTKDSEYVLLHAESQVLSLYKKLSPECSNHLSNSAEFCCQGDSRICLWAEDGRMQMLFGCTVYGLKASADGMYDRILLRPSKRPNHLKPVQLLAVCSCCTLLQYLPSSA